MCDDRDVVVDLGELHPDRLHDTQAKLLKRADRFDALRAELDELVSETRNCDRGYHEVFSETARDSFDDTLEKLGITTWLIHRQQPVQDVGDKILVSIDPAKIEDLKRGFNCTYFQIVPLTDGTWTLKWWATDEELIAEMQPIKERADFDAYVPTAASDPALLETLVQGQPSHFEEETLQVVERYQNPVEIPLMGNDPEAEVEVVTGSSVTIPFLDKNGVEQPVEAPQEVTGPTASQAGAVDLTHFDPTEGD